MVVGFFSPEKSSSSSSSIFSSIPPTHLPTKKKEGVGIIQSNRNHNHDIPPSLPPLSATPLPPPKKPSSFPLSQPSPSNQTPPPSPSFFPTQKPFFFSISLHPTFNVKFPFKKLHRALFWGGGQPRRERGGKEGRGGEERDEFFECFNWEGFFSL